MKSFLEHVAEDLFDGFCIAFAPVLRGKDGAA